MEKFKKLQKKLSFIRPYGFSQMSVYDIIVFLFNSIRNGDYSNKSAVMAFNFFLALFPSLLFFFTLIPFIPIDNFQEITLQQIKTILPSNSFYILNSAIEEIIVDKNHGLMSIGFLLSIYYLSKFFNKILALLNESHLLSDKSNFWKQRLYAFFLFIKTFLLILITIFLSFGTDYFLSKTSITDNGVFITILISLIKWGLIFGFLLLSTSMIYRYAITNKIKISFINAGSLTTVVTIILMTYGMTIYFENFSSYNKIFGIIGGFLISLIWVKTLSFIFIAGFDLYTKICLQKERNSIT